MKAWILSDVTDDCGNSLVFADTVNEERQNTKYELC